MFYLLLICTAIYIYFILFIISGLFKHNVLPVAHSKNLPFVSVVIAARNEENNLPELLDDLINQEYPLNKFEIIIVNDRSSDSTPEILKNASDNYAFIKTININKKSKVMTPKKNAVNEGIKSSKGEIILATDADCRMGALWIASMAYSLMNKNSIIIGYSEISDIKKSYFEKYQKLDFLAILIANAGASGWNQYWSGTGQNLAYYKKDYFEIGGFHPVKSKISGDDMYLVQSISNIKRGYTHIDPNSFVKTKAMSTIKDFINQRIRWSSNSKSNFKNEPLFFTFLLTSFLENFLILLSILFFKQGYLFWALKIFVDGVVILFGSKLFDRKFDLKTYTIWAFLQPVYIPLIGFLGLFNKFSWKK